MIDKDIIIDCLNHTWDIIGGDILQMAEEHFGWKN